MTMGAPARRGGEAGGGRRWRRGRGDVGRRCFFFFLFALIPDLARRDGGAEVERVALIVSMYLFF